MSKCVSFLLAGVVWTAAPCSLTAQPVTDARVRELTELALARAEQGQIVPAGPGVDLTIEAAVARAIDRNLDLAVERLNPRTFDYSIASLLAAYRPTATASLSNRSQVTLPNSQLTGVTDKLNTETFSWAGGFSQGVEWGGGSFSVQFTNARQDSSNSFATRNPSFNSTIVTSYTQPLLRNFKIDGTRTSLETTRISQDVSEITLEQTTATTIAGVRNAYWDLVYTIRAVEVAQQSLALASKLVADNRQRVEIGTMAPIDVVQAQAEEATRRQAVVQAEQTRRTAELALKRLIVSGTEDELWGATINPVDQPAFSEQPIDLEGAVRRALEHRTDLRRSRKQLESNDVSLRSLRNQTLPAVDLTANYELRGLGGTQFERRGLGGSISQIIPGGYIDALSNLANFDAPTWSVQMNVSYPLGTSSADANLARARLQLQQTEAQIKQLELQVATEVTNIALQLRSNIERVQAASAARELSQKRLEAEQSKFEVGLQTNFIVVQAQRDLADSQNTELRAILDYTKSLVDFERVQIAGAGSSVSTISGAGGGTATAAATATGGGGGGGGTIR